MVYLKAEDSTLSECSVFFHEGHYLPLHGMLHICNIG